MQNQQSNRTNLFRTRWSPTWKQLVITMMGGIVGINVLTGCQDSKPTATPETKPSPTASTEPTTEKKAEKPAEPKTTADKKATGDKPTGDKPTPEADNNQDKGEPDKARRRRKKDVNNIARNTDATIIGGSGSKNIRSGPGVDYNVLHLAYPGDRVKVIQTSRDQQRFAWYKIYFPKTRAEGWVTASLIQMDSGRFAPQDLDPTPVKPTIYEDVEVPDNHNRFDDGTNATISGSGSKNIRSGPGTNYDAPHVAYPGDRVSVGESAEDVDGYTWYHVYFPKSGADGWIAAQLLDID